MAPIDLKNAGLDVLHVVIEHIMRGDDPDVGEKRILRRRDSPIYWNLIGKNPPCSRRAS